MMTEGLWKLLEVLDVPGVGAEGVMKRFTVRQLQEILRSWGANPLRGQRRVKLGLAQEVVDLYPQHRVVDLYPQHRGQRRPHTTRTTRTVPAPSPAAAAGLDVVINLAQADAAADPERYCADHGVWDALEWLRAVSYYMDAAQAARKAAVARKKASAREKVPR